MTERNDSQKSSLLQVKSIYVRMVAFLLLLGFICSGFYMWNQRLFNSIYPKLPAEKKIIAVGSSLSQYSLSDQIIDSFLNLSQEGRTGLSTYQCIEAIMKENPHVETIVVDFSVMATVGYRDYLFFIPAFAQGQFDRNYPITSYKNLKQYPLHLKYYFLSLMNNEWVPNITYLDKKLYGQDAVDLDFPYLGSYSPKIGSRNNWNMEGWMKRAKQLQWLTGENYPVSETDLNFAKEIPNLLSKHDIRIIIYCAPLHPDVAAIVPEIYWNNYHDFLNQARLEDRVDVYDFTHFPLPDSAYINFSHVNIDGAKAVSSAFLDSLRINGVLNLKSNNNEEQRILMDKKSEDHGL